MPWSSEGSGSAFLGWRILFAWEQTAKARATKLWVYLRHLWNSVVSSDADCEVQGCDCRHGQTAKLPNRRTLTLVARFSWVGEWVCKGWKMYCYQCVDKTEHGNKFCGGSCRTIYRERFSSIKKFFMALGRQTRFRKKAEAGVDKYKITA